MEHDPFYAFIDRTLIKVTGNDRLRVINNFFTNAVMDLHTGQGIEGFFPNPKGKINGHGFVFIDDDAIWIEGSAEQAKQITELITGFVITEDVAFEDLSAEMDSILVAGNLDAEHQPKRELGMSKWSDGLGPGFQFRSTCLFPDATILYRSFEFAQQAVEHLRVDGFVEKSFTEVDSMRTAVGQPIFGTDFDEGYFPQEVGQISRTVSFTKGCYLGQETIARIDSLGHVNQHVVSVEIETAERPSLPAPITIDGKPIGKVTSATDINENTNNATVWRGIATLRVPYHQPGCQLDQDFGTLTVK